MDEGVCGNNSKKNRIQKSAVFDGNKWVKMSHFSEMHMQTSHSGHADLVPAAKQVCLVLD